MLQTVLLNAMDPFPPADQGSGARIILTVEVVPDTAVADPLQATCVTFSGAGARLELTTLLQTLRRVDGDPSAGVDHAAAIALGEARQHDQAAAAFLGLAVRGDAPVAALYGLATQLFHGDKVRQARQVAQFLAAVWTDDPRPLAILGTILGELSAVRDARNSLAKAAHLSRRDPGFRGVLRYSQRELLKLQFHDQADPQGRKA